MSAMRVERPWSDECPCGRAHGDRQPSRMKSACTTCGRIHTSTDAIAVGRFQLDGPIGYVAASAGSPIRATRTEAEADECAQRPSRPAITRPEGGPDTTHP